MLTILKIMLPDLLKKFNSKQCQQQSQKDLIVERLLKEGHITAMEATVLLRTVSIELKADTLEMSSGAKIVGGSDFETTDYGK